MWLGTPSAGRRQINRGSGKAMILYYVVLKDRLLTWEIRNGRVRLDQWSISGAVLDREIDRYRDALFRGWDDDRRRVATELFELLLKLAYRELGHDETLVIVPDAKLHLLPFPTLVDDVSDLTRILAHSISRYLGQQVDPGLFQES